MKLSFALILTMVQAIVKKIIENISPLIRDELVLVMARLKVKAEKTPNEWDNMLIDFFYDMLDIK